MEELADSIVVIIVRIMTEIGIIKIHSLSWNILLTSRAVSKRIPEKDAIKLEATVFLSWFLSVHTPPHTHTQ